MASKRVFDSITDIIDEFPPSDDQVADLMKQTFCESVSELAPAGTHHLVARACKTVLGVNETPCISCRAGRNGVLEDTPLECTTERGWFGSEQTSCSVKK
jgi:hypothetical protein